MKALVYSIAATTLILMVLYFGSYVLLLDHGRNVVTGNRYVLVDHEWQMAFYAPAGRVESLLRGEPVTVTAVVDPFAE